MSNFDKDYLHEQFLRGQLTAEEKSAFDKMLASDPEFSREVKAGELAVEGLKSYHLHQRIQEVREQVQKQQLPSQGGQKEERRTAKLISIFRKPMALAASFMLVVVAAYFLYISISTQSLYNQYNQHPSFAVTEMSSSPSYDLSRAEGAFKQGNYDITNSELSSYLSENPRDTMALLFQGICQLELSDYIQAENIFSEIKSGSSDFQPLGEWYLALTFVKQNDFDRARQELENISPGSEKYAQAQQLLKSLN